MKRRMIRGRKAAALAALMLIVAAILFGTTLLERAQQGKRERELQAERQKLRVSQWTDDNTVVLNGDLYEYDHRIETFLFIGTDNSGNKDPKDFRGPMADFLLLMVLDHTENTIAWLQIDRNTVTPVRELDWSGEEIETRELQICTAHWYGRSPEMAAENTVYAVREYLGGLDRIDGYFEMNLDDIGKLNHAVGGVEVTVEDDLEGVDSTLTKGRTLVLDDGQAAAFLRARMNVGEGTNAERMARQRQYMASFFEKVRTETMKDPKFGIELWNLLKDAAVTDMNGNDFSRIAQKLLKGTNKDMHTVAGTTVLGKILQDGLEHEEFYPDRQALKEKMIDLFSLKRISVTE